MIQELRANPVSGVAMPIGITPEGNKVVRMEAQCARFEAGQVYLPKEAPWLSEFLHEILAFPNSRYDDQIDSVSQFLKRAEANEHPHLRWSGRMQKFSMVTGVKCRLVVYLTEAGV